MVSRSVGTDEKFATLTFVPDVPDIPVLKAQQASQPFFIRNLVGRVELSVVVDSRAN
jgi:hypothetical protein